MTKARARGASFVEYLVIGGAVALVSLGAARAFSGDVARAWGAEAAAVSGIDEDATTSASAVAAERSPENATGPIAVAEPRTWRDAVVERASSTADAAGGVMNVAASGSLRLGRGVFVDGALGAAGSTWALAGAMLRDPEAALLATWEGFAHLLTDPGGAIQDAADDFMRRWDEDPIRAVGGSLFAMTPVGHITAFARAHERGRAFTSGV